MWHNVQVFDARFVCDIQCTVLRKILRKRKILRSYEALPILRSYVLRTIQNHFRMIPIGCVRLAPFDDVRTRGSRHRVLDQEMCSVVE
jgi:hypothetical protein